MTKKARLRLIKEVHQLMHYEWGLTQPDYEDFDEELALLSKPIVEDEDWAAKIVENADSFSVNK